MAAEDDFDYGGEENRMSEVSAVTDVNRKFLYGIIAHSCKFCNVHLLCSQTYMHHISYYSFNADWSECISREFAREARGEFYLLFVKLTYL